MSERLPRYYFRLKENGATLCLVEVESRQKRINLQELANINLKNGVIRAHGNYQLNATDEAAIADWISQRRALLARREAEALHLTIEQLNQTAHWAQSKATDAELEAISDQLLLAMHDLRAVLVRKKSERLLQAQSQQEMVD